MVYNNFTASACSHRTFLSTRISSEGRNSTKRIFTTCAHARQFRSLVGWVVGVPQGWPRAQPRTARRCAEKGSRRTSLGTKALTRSTTQPRYRLSIRPLDGPFSVFRPYLPPGAYISTPGCRMASRTHQLLGRPAAATCACVGAARGRPWRGAASPVQRQGSGRISNAKRSEIVRGIYGVENSVGAVGRASLY